MIAVTGSGQLVDGVSHCREFGDLRLDLGNVRQSKPLYICADASLVLPETDQQAGPLN